MVALAEIFFDQPFAGPEKSGDNIKFESFKRLKEIILIGIRHNVTPKRVVTDSIFSMEADWMSKK
jgi:hypothetical protein